MYQIKVAKEICEKCISDHSVKPNLTIEEQAMLFPTFFLAYKEKIIEKSEVRTKIGKKIIIKFDNISNNEFIDEIISLSQYIFAKIKSSDKFKYEIDANIEVIFEQEELIEKDKLNQLKQALILIQKIADCFGHNEYEFIDDFTKIKIENENGTRTINYSNLLFELNINSLYNKIFHFEYNYFKSINNKTLIFINMLNKGKSNILNKKNTETFEGTTIPVRHFWNNNNKDKIIQKLFVEEKNNPEYETARQTILDYYDVSSYEELLNELQKRSENKKQSQSISPKEKITIFINMLNQSNYNILNKKNTETFEGTTIPVRHFWNNNKDKIIQKLFVEEKNNPEYETARQTILDYFKKNYFEFINDLLELREIKLSKPTTQFSISTLNSDTNTDDSLDRKEKNSYYINEISLSGYDNDDIDGKIHSLFCDNLLSELVKLMNFKEDCEMKYEHASIYHYLKELFIKIEETLEKEEYHNLDLTKYYEYFKFSEENNVSKKVKSLKNKYITFFQRLQEDLKNDKIPFEIKLSLINQCLEQMEQDLSDLNKEISRHIRNSLRHVRYDENSNGTIRLQDKEEGSAEIKFECEMEICEVKTMADTCFEYLEKGNNLNFIQRLIKCINQIKVLFGEDEEFSKYLTNIGFYLICVIEKIKEENEEDEAKLS